MRRAEGPETSAGELDALCRERLAAFKRPRHWVFVEEFSLKGSGKVRKRVLRERFEAGEFD